MNESEEVARTRGQGWSVSKAGTSIWQGDKKEVLLRKRKKEIAKQDIECLLYLDKLNQVNTTSVLCLISSI